MVLKRLGRQQEIITHLREHGTQAIADLAKAFEVSEETIRRELRVLEEEGVVMRLHGAARLAPLVLEGPLEKRMQENAEAKMRIAEAAAALVPDGAIVFIDAGTTSCYIAKTLRNHHELTVIANSLVVASELGGRNGNKLFLAGGQMDYDYHAFSDKQAQDFVAGFTPHLAILSVGAIHHEQGLMDYHPGEAVMSRIAYATSGKVMLAADASKFGRYGLMQTAPISAVDILVTDKPLDEAYEKAFSGATVVVA